MYPDWPETAADLVPLPLVDGPKLAAFDFHGPQPIEFLGLLGQGSHAYVLQVRIHEQEYALKLFRFLDDFDWYGPGDTGLNDKREQLELLAQYAEPFYCECRAFGRLHESGHEDLATPCYGYILLDEEHENTLIERFKLKFNGNMEMAGYYDDLRPRFPGKRTGRPPPIRGILKGLGTAGLVNDPPNLTVSEAKRILRDTIKLQQLGIFYLDTRRDQLIDKRFCDFSVSITTPHFVTNPELNPNLSEIEKEYMVEEAFTLAIGDYLNFETLLMEAMEEKRQTTKLFDKVAVFPGGVPRYRANPRTRLRSISDKPYRVYTLVDPRTYVHNGRGVKGVRDSRVPQSGAKTAKAKTKAKAKPSRDQPKQHVHRVPLSKFPEKWYFECPLEKAIELRRERSLHTRLTWVVEDDGYMYPVRTG